MSTPNVPAPAAPAAPAVPAPAAPAPADTKAAPAAAESPKLPAPLVSSEGAAPAADPKAAPAASENDFTEWPKDFDDNVKGTLSDLGKELATELKLDGAGKTSVMKALATRWESATADAAKRDEEAFVKQANEHTQQAAEHPDVKALGGVDKAKVMASTALQKLGNPKLNDLLARTGLAYHPEVLAFFAKVGKSLGEDSVAGGTSSTRSVPTQRQELEARYPHPTSKSMFTE